MSHLASVHAAPLWVASDEMQAIATDKVAFVLYACEMLRQLNFTNFKSWSSATVSFGKVTGLFGTNSSGKSSIIQLLLLLKQTKEATDRAISLEFNGPYVSLGLYRDLIHSHNEELELTWDLQFEREKDLALVDPRRKRTESFVRGRSVRVSSTVRALDRAGSKTRAIERSAIAEELEYELDGVKFRLAPKVPGDVAFELTSEGGDFRFTRTVGRKWQLPGPIKSYAFPDQARTYFQNASLLSDLEAAFEEQVDGVYYLGPLREFPKRDYLWARSRPRDVGIRGERAIDAILAATMEGEMRNRVYRGKLRPFQEMVAFWLSEMGLIDAFEVREIAPNSDRWQAHVRVRKGGPYALLTDVGFGVSQVLPIITLLLYVPEGSTVILEQPEIHLHPLAQSGLADVILSVAKTRNVQVIVESHSEHLLLRLQRRVAEGDVSDKDIKLYFCDASSESSHLMDLVFCSVCNFNNPSATNRYSYGGDTDGQASQGTGCERRAAGATRVDCTLAELAGGAGAACANDLAHGRW